MNENRYKLAYKFSSEEKKTDINYAGINESKKDKKRIEIATVKQPATLQ